MDVMKRIGLNRSYDYSYDFMLLIEKKEVDIFIMSSYKSQLENVPFILHFYYILSFFENKKSHDQV